MGTGAFRGLEPPSPRKRRFGTPFGKTRKRPHISGLRAARTAGGWPPKRLPASRYAGVCDRRGGPRNVSAFSCFRFPSPKVPFIRASACRFGAFVGRSRPAARNRHTRRSVASRGLFCLCTVSRCFYLYISPASLEWGSWFRDLLPAALTEQIVFVVGLPGLSFSTLRG